MNCRIQRLRIRWKPLNKYFSYIAMHWCTTVFILVTAPFYLLICHVDTRVIFEKDFTKFDGDEKLLPNSTTYILFLEAFIFFLLFCMQTKLVVLEV